MKTSRTLTLASAPLLLVCAMAPAAAQRVEQAPADLDEVGVTQRLDEQLPLDLAFVDDRGAPVVLGDYFRPGKPVLLTLAYYKCPMLCTLVLDGMVQSLREIDWVPGDEFEVVTVSIDPRETPELAREKKQTYVRSYGRERAADGWHFLTGEPTSIEALAEAVGFRYRYLEDRGEYAHPAALFLLTPDGRISRYLFGVNHDPKTVRLSLVEASEGKIGSAIDKFLLYCYRYDAEEGRYAPVAMQIMRVGGTLTAVLLGVVLLAFWLKEARQRRKRLV